MNRDQLISRKHEVKHQLAQAQRQLEQARVQWRAAAEGSSDSPRDAADATASKEAKSSSRVALIWHWIRKGLVGPRSQQAKIARLEHQVTSLMAEEYRLRCAIDRS